MDRPTVFGVVCCVSLYHLCLEASFFMVYLVCTGHTHAHSVIVRVLMFNRTKFSPYLPLHGALNTCWPKCRIH